MKRIAHYLIHCELEKLPAGGNEEREAECAENCNGNRNGFLIALLHCNNNLIACKHAETAAEKMHSRIPPTDIIVEVEELSAEGSAENHCDKSVLNNRRNVS